MPHFTEEEKVYIKKFVILDLEDRIGMADGSAQEDAILSGIVEKLKEMCDA